MQYSRNDGQSVFFLQPIVDLQPVYLGSVLDKFGGTEADIKRRLAVARIAFTRLQNIIIIIIKSLFILIKNRSANQRIGWFKPVISINIIENLQLVTKIKFTNVNKI